MGLFKSKFQKELESLTERIDMDMANNYKDNAQADFRDFQKRFLEMKEEGVLKEKELVLFEEAARKYQEKLKGYTHNDQKPYWT